MNNHTNKVMTSVEWMLLLVLGLIWGGSFFFNRIALARLPVFTVVLGRVTLGGLALIGLGPAGLPDRDREDRGEP
ncbi:MAG: EamA family transporter [Thermodesulfobacteriota bacterium]